MSKIAVNQITDSAGLNAFPTQMIMPIGTVFMVWDNLTAASIDNSLGNFIKLTAGEDGAGEFNEGLLIAESVSGSAPLVDATAEIATGPLTGETVHLINTEESVLRARDTSGELQMDQMQKITGRSGDTNAFGATQNTFGWYDKSFIGALNVELQSSSQVVLNGVDDRNSAARFGFDSSGSPDARTSSTTDGETRAKNVSATAYMRIA